ncbi:PWI domain-containing protein [Psidium guajava]|nr:PWI domain-containing protein [Psidium guajava]
MGSESNLKTWVSDKLMSLLGYSQSTIVQYFIELAKQASSSAQVVDKLVEFGLSSSSETCAFAEEVFARVPHKAAGLNLYQKQEREAALLARKQKTYAILDADDDDRDDSKHNVREGGIDNGSSSITTPETDKGASRKKRFRKKSESHEDEDEESFARVDEERMVKRRTSHDEDGGSESEEERSRDQREREELEQHLKARDAAGTRKVHIYH